MRVPVEFLLPSWQLVEQVPSSEGYRDCVNGVAIADGTEWQVKWPDGSVTSEVVRVHRDVVRRGGEFEADEVEYWAFVEINYRGKTMFAGIRWLEVR